MKKLMSPNIKYYFIIFSRLLISVRKNSVADHSSSSGVSLHYTSLSSQPVWVMLSLPTVTLGETFV